MMELTESRKENKKLKKENEKLIRVEEELSQMKTLLCKMKQFCKEKGLLNDVIEQLIEGRLSKDVGENTLFKETSHNDRSKHILQLFQD